MMLADEELKKLEETRKELLDKAIELRNKLSENQKSSGTNKIPINRDEVITTIEELLPRKSLSKNNNTKTLGELSSTVAGIVYQNTSKKWLGDNIWQYAAMIELKDLKFKLKVTIDKKSPKNNEIVDITCSFIRTEICYLQEVSPWVLELAKIKNFSFLMSAFSEYGCQCAVRKKILDKLKNKKIVTLESCQDERGGIIAYIHSSKNADKSYAKYLWRTQLNPKTMAINHVFTIEEVDDGFLNANQQIIENFCKKPLKKEDLEELWNDLCIAIDEYNP
ncbi:uncharacterized protein LOC103579634 [Microplitis demolitor]|uniref:uncharacterized protein LOC103579634 n=1 Tax=Microplitis demolitor TaxID=69319 RepID=UPI0004CDD524|nr:uncharacterized protein LOC103579634 [Microplitis demolitor]